MLLQHLRGLVLSAFAWPSCCSPPLLPFSRRNVIVPRGPVVEIDAGCTYAPLAFAGEGQVVVMWYRSSGPSGIWARRGPSLGELGPEVLLAETSVGQRLQVVAQPGFFVLAWNTDGALSRTFFQRFGLDLAPLAPEGRLGSRHPRTTPAMLANADGEVTLGFFDEAMLYRLRRFAADDAPLTLSSTPMLPSAAGCSSRPGTWPRAKAASWPPGPAQGSSACPASRCVLSAGTARRPAPPAKSQELPWERRRIST